MSSCDIPTEQMSPISVLARLWPYECRTEPQLLHNSGASYLSGTLTDVPGKEVNSAHFVPFALCSVRPLIISAPQADHLRPYPERDVIRSRKRCDKIRGARWDSVNVVNMETASTLRAGIHAQLMYTVFEFLQCRVRVEASLLAFPPHRQLRVHAWNAVLRQIVNLYFPSVKTEIMLTSLLIWRLIDARL